jgi:hypothetical protein
MLLVERPGFHAASFHIGRYDHLTTSLAIIHLKQIFYTFLTDSFRDSPGLNFVLTKKIRIINGYNNEIIDQHNWEVAIQPAAQITMSILLRQLLKGEKSPLPACGRTILLDKTKRWGNG